MCLLEVNAPICKAVLVTHTYRSLPQCHTSSSAVQPTCGDHICPTFGHCQCAHRDSSGLTEPRCPLMGLSKKKYRLDRYSIEYCHLYFSQLTVSSVTEHNSKCTTVGHTNLMMLRCLHLVSPLFCVGLAPITYPCVRCLSLQARALHTGSRNGACV